MWPIPSLQRELVSISFSSDALTCCWIQKSTISTAPLIMRAYRRYPLDNLEIMQLMPFNPTTIKKYIARFLSEYNLHNAFVVFCLDVLVKSPIQQNNPKIFLERGPHSLVEWGYEKCIALPTSTPQVTDFDMPKNSSMLWEYRYLYGDHDGHYIFYVYAIPRSLILSYELLAIALRCNLIGITTKTATLLAAYKNIFGTAFRKSQLALDMMKHNNDVQKLITNDAVRRMVSFSANVSREEYATIAAACGIFYEFIA